VLLVHYKKEQLMAGMLPRRLRAATVWAEWGPVPVPMRSGIPRLAYVLFAPDVGDFSYELDNEGELGDVLLAVQKRVSTRTSRPAWRSSCTSSAPM